MSSVILLKCVGRKFFYKCPRVTVSGTTGIHIVGDLQAGNLLKKFYMPTEEQVYEIGHR
jgi:hypothetical protein